MARVRWLLCIVLLIVGPSSAAGQFPTVLDGGRPYVELARIADSLRVKVDGTPASTRAHLRTGTHVVTLTRNVSQVLVDGRPVALGAPVRVRQGVWLVPETFVTRVLPRVSPPPAASPATARAAPPRAAPRATPAKAAPVTPAPTATLEELRYRSYPTYTRVVLETSTAVEFQVDGKGPREVRVRVAGLGVEPRIEEVGDGFIQALRLERVGADTMLVVAFEGSTGELKTMALSDPPRVVLDFVRPEEREPAQRRVEASPLRVVVLDAGHGGHDPGAIGPTGLTEKELVLDVTRRVARLVEDRLGIRVLLTRDTDRFIPLRERTTFANRAQADLFVSIHANAHREANSEGVEIYFLSSEATDSTARQVAALENASIRFEKPAARERMDLVKSILWDLAQSEFQLESSRVAEVVLDSMTRTLRMTNRGVKQAGFYVLGGAAMPAVLIEIGFVTNPREERKLRDHRYRHELALAITEGLAEYKRQWDQRMKTALEAAPSAPAATAGAPARGSRER